jgi:hypothetical protein
MLTALFNKPYDEQLAFFRQKGYLFSPNGWQDVWKEAHTRAFTVARVTEMSVLQHLRESLDRAMEKGESFDKWRKSLDLTDWTRQRLNIVWRTNLSTAYHTGRYKQQTDLKHRRPWWQYKITPLRPSERNRDTHKAHKDKVFHADHKFWRIAYPPNGYQCLCYTNTLSDRELEQSGLIPEDDGYEVRKEDRPDKGWDYNPGRAGLDSYRPDYETLMPDLRRKLKMEIERGAAKAGLTALAGIMPMIARERVKAKGVIDRITYPKINDILDDDEKLVLVNVDVEKFDPVWARDKGMYIGPNGQGAIEGRAVKVMEYYETGKPIDASEVDVESDGSVAFIDGRHRYAVLRDMGAKTIPMAMTAESAMNAKKAGFVR